jgi:hypothetical protein
MAATTQSQGWHVANWGLWGWIETGLKLIGIGAGFLAFFGSSSAAEMIVGGNPNLAAVILLALLTLGLLAAVFMRVAQKEIISLIFSILNVLGHAGILIALLRTPDQQTLPLIFGVFFVLGELAKQRFLAISGYTEAGQSGSAMLMFSRVVLAIYVVFIIFILL